MAYTLKYCYEIYVFFNKDFFEEELGQKLGPCQIITDKKEAEKIFEVSNFDTASGLSLTWKGKNYIWLNKYLFENKKLLLNTILHEMIHLYDNLVNPTIRKYRSGHGAYWTKTAKYATALYGKQIGAITRFTDAHESERLKHYKMMKQTKTLSNVFLVKLSSWELVPIKDLTDEQIEILKGTDIIGIYKVKPGIEQSEKNRVQHYATFQSLMEDIEGGLTEEEEELFSHLKIDVAKDTTVIWLRRK